MPPPHPLPPPVPQPPLEREIGGAGFGAGNQNHFARLMREIAGIRDQAQAARELREARNQREPRNPARNASRQAARDG